MESLSYSAIVEANEADLKRTIERALSDLVIAQQTYPGVILEAVNSGFVANQIEKTMDEVSGDPLSDPNNIAAGAYFANENVIGGSRVDMSVQTVNALGTRCVPGWINDPIKKKIGPGIGYALTPRVYRTLLDQGIANPDYSLNYTAPFGNKEARIGMKKIMDARIDPEKDIFPENGVFLTDGATEGIDLFMESLARLSPGANVVFLGLSYYTGPFAAQQKGLTIDRLIKNPTTNTGEMRFLPTVSEIAACMPANTKAFVLTIPNNPNGETYSLSEMNRLLRLAKERNIYILFDAIFENMSFDESQNFRSQFLQTAYEVGALSQVVIVDSLSKTKNIPGERIGFLATTNTSFINELINVTMARRCNPRLTLGPIMQFEGLARTVKAMQLNDPDANLKSIIDQVLGNTSLFTRSSFLPMYSEWDNWNNQILAYYRGNLQIVRALLGTSVSGWSPDSAAYNTLVRMGGIPLNTNSMDYLAKLMFTTATYTQVGPCFGLSQRTWDETLGIWTRITYACGRNDLVEGLKRLIVFSRIYAEKELGNGKKFPVLTLSYDQQI